MGYEKVTRGKLEKEVARKPKDKKEKRDRRNHEKELLRRVMGGDYDAFDEDEGME